MLKLNFAFGVLGASYRVEWDRAPQHLSLRVDTCRAVKDKVPRGEYVLSASIWDKIGTISTLVQNTFLSRASHWVDVV